MELQSDDQEPFVPGPQRGARDQSKRCEEMRIDLADAFSKQFVLINEMKHFTISGRACLRQIAQGAQDEIALPQMTECELIDHKVMCEDLSSVQKLNKILVAV